MNLLIRDATIITVDPSRRVLEPGAVYVEGVRIVDVGPTLGSDRTRCTAGSWRAEKIGLYVDDGLCP